MSEQKTESVAGIEPRKRSKGRRRRFLVNRRYQFKVALLTVSMMLVLLVLLNFSLLTSSMKDTEAALSVAPEFKEYMQGQDQVQFTLVLLASLVFMVGVFLVSLLESHKTAGAAVNICNRMEEIRRGTFSARVRLRKDDNLKEIEPVFNRMAETLAERAWNDVELLERMAERLQQAKDLETVAAISTDFQEEAARRRQALG